jgi:signal transduction histidine kinase
VVTASWGDIGREAARPYDVWIRGDGTQLGHITVLVPKGRNVCAVDARILQDIADQAAVAFRNTAMETELAARVETLDRTTRALAESRARIIDADDDARRALEAAISHDVLPRLVALPGQLDRARGAVMRRSGEHGLDGLVSDTNAALEDLRELTRGVYPTLLARTGLEPALRSLLARSGLAASLHVDAEAAGTRFARRVEGAVYFCCVAAVPMMSPASSLALTATGDDLRLRISGVAGTGMDVQAIEDRVAAVDGSLATDTDGLEVCIPCASVVPALTVSAMVAG